MQESNLPQTMQSNEQQVYLNHIVQENEFNAFCVDCQNNRSSHCNVTFGTFICGDCALIHTKEFPLQSYVKPLTEVFDPFQLQVTAIGGNQKFYEFTREYQKERVGISIKYKTDSSLYYRKKLVLTARGIPFDEKAPPKNAQEAAERAAEAVKLNANKGYNATKEGITNVNEKYKISETSSEYANKAKAGIMGLFAKKEATPNP